MCFVRLVNPAHSTSSSTHNWMLSFFKHTKIKKQIQKMFIPNICQIIFVSSMRPPLLLSRFIISLFSSKCELNEGEIWFKWFFLFECINVCVCVCLCVWVSVFTSIRCAENQNRSYHIRKFLFFRRIHSNISSAIEQQICTIKCIQSIDTE